MSAQGVARRKPAVVTCPDPAKLEAATFQWLRDKADAKRPPRRRAIAIVDLGGQYCHLIARRLRDIGVWADIYPSSVHGDVLAGYGGVILSGGPRSVYDDTSPSVDGILSLSVPVLGICYGHQLLARELGAKVEPGDEEYGVSRLQISGGDILFDDTPRMQTVWMSHSDAVLSLPTSVTVLARTERCEVAAFADHSRNLFGLQFHPEVTHTEFGKRILENFALKVCALPREQSPAVQVAHLLDQIKFQVGKRSVFFLVSGGVDSTVAFSLCAKALPSKQLLGVYVDTGLMRKGETDELRASLEHFDLGARLEIRDESKRFLDALKDCLDPEAKRKIIGRLFLDVQSEAMREYGIEGENWLLGQGTIYPDTIESGGRTGSAALIKTHHNRCAEIRALLDAGLVIEPLAEFYKDEVRQIGEALGLSPRITKRWPFPGPGLAIRCLCTSSEHAERVPRAVDLPSEYRDYTAVSIPLQSVGVQGDGRTYRDVVAVQGALDYPALQKLSSHLCNVGKIHNRVIFQLAGDDNLSRFSILPKKTLTPDRLDVLRAADFIARSYMEHRRLTDTVWQFPVVLIPLSASDGESIVLRPVNSEDGMTASFARLEAHVLQNIANEICGIVGVDAVFLDISDKPPATIEWE
jgi:GMP synthase (glutamine-hydrolysing)